MNSRSIWKAQVPGSTSRGFIVLYRVRCPYNVLGFVEPAPEFAQNQLQQLMLKINEIENSGNAFLISHKILLEGKLQSAS